MKIGFDAKRIFHNSSGLGNYSRDIVRALGEYYPENNYLLYNPKPGKIDRLLLGGNIRQVYPEGFLNKKFSSIWRRGPIVRQLKRDGIDVFHGLSNELPSGINKAGVPSVVTIHDLIFMRYPEWYPAPDRAIYALKVKQAAKRASRILAISKQTRDDLVRFLNLPAEKIEVIYQGCHPAFKKVHPNETREMVRKKFRLPEQFLLSVGTIEPRKNLLTVVKSLQYHSLPLVVVGRETDYAQKVKDYIRENSLDKRVHFLSNVSMDELAVICQVATVFCYLSVFEGFGIPVIEALYSCTPVITTEGGCFAEAGGPDSVYINPDDEKLLAEKVNQLLQDVNLRQQIVSRGFEYVQQFNDHTIADKIMQLYQAVVNG